MRHALALLVAGPLAAAAALCAACGSSGSNPPPVLGSIDSGTASHPDSSISGDDGGGSDGTPAGDSSSTSDGVSPVDGASDAGDAGTLFSPQCDPTATWSTIARDPSIPSAGFDRFDSVSGDGRTVVWTTAAGVLMYADRSSSTAAFGTPGPVVAADGGAFAVANDRVAIDPTGTQLIAISSGGGSFLAIDRSTRGAPWGPGDKKQFSVIAGALGTGEGDAGPPLLSQPVLSGDALSLFYLALNNGVPTLYESPWSAGLKVWEIGAALQGAAFTNTATGQVRRPTGAGSDRLTLFFFDETVGHERAAWRDQVSDPFSTFAELPNVPEAVPSDSCNTLYFRGTDADAGGPGLYTAQ